MSSDIANPWPGAHVIAKEKTGSTMEDALALARQGYPSGSCVVAGYQEKGRGREPGRRWESAPGDNLLVSVALDKSEPQCEMGLLPLACGLAVARAVSALLPEPALVKWPNDVLFRGKKLAGILCENRAQCLVIGVGVNCNQTVFPPLLADHACSLRQITGAAVDLAALCTRVLAELKRIMAQSQWIGELEGRLAFIGSKVTVSAPGSSKVWEGMLSGIDARGGLILATDRGETCVLRHGELRQNP